MDQVMRPTLAVDGFEEMMIGLPVSAENTQTCSQRSCTNGCSRDCSKGCSLDETFAASAEAWERFVALEAGSIQF